MTAKSDDIAALSTDAIEIEVFAKMFGAIVEQMGVTLARTAHTTFVRETQDFGVALATVNGEFFAYPRTLGASVLLGLPFADCIRAIPEYHDGDIVMTNDPFLSKAGCTHVPDLTIWMPIFVDGEILCFAWGFVHSSDIGGSVPGSIAPSLTDTFQEGVRIPPVKLYRRGQVNEDVRDIIKNNVRIPQQVWGDIQAVRAALMLANRKVKAHAERYGRQKLTTVIDDLLLYAEIKARGIFRQIPAGTYRFTDYVEDDTISDVPIRLNLTMTVEDGRIHLDYTGTDPQVAAAYNVPTAGKVHPWVISGLALYVISQDPDIPTNAGYFRALSVELPEGCLLNPVFPASIGLRSLAGVRIIDLILATLGQAVPERVPAAGSGVSTVVMLSVPDYERGGRRINVVNPCVGGSGGRPTADGFDGVDFMFGFLRNTPAEILEAETFMLMRRFWLARDSGGPGRFRGGLGVGIEFQVLAPDAKVIARGIDRTKFDPWGVHGGLPGMRMASTLVNPGTNAERSIRKVDVLHLQAGDIVRFRSPGGGGYGDPLERDSAHVLDDLERGFVSAEAAEALYGIVLDGRGGVDEKATHSRRAAIRADRGSDEQPMFALGEHRRALDRLWPLDARSALSGVLSGLPILMRYEVKNRIYTSLTTSGRDSPVSADDVVACWTTLRAEVYDRHFAPFER